VLPAEEEEELELPTGGAGFVIIGDDDLAAEGGADCPTVDDDAVMDVREAATVPLDVISGEPAPHEQKAGCLEQAAPGEPEPAAPSTGSAPSTCAKAKKDAKVDCKKRPRETTASNNKAEKDDKQASKKKKKGSGKGTAGPSDEEDVVIPSEQECLDLGGTKPPSHVSCNVIYSNAYKHSLKSVNCTIVAKEAGRLASAIFSAHGLVLPGTTGQFRSQPRKPNQKKPDASEKSDAPETPQNGES
jgi:hypothetical protein